ncbi:DUF6326 family protein [Wenyingzhuangia sp. 1_MG-2023]|nr:DUF6326 family protein [Wenyingzhuangia sp. 1_MG-2023]
MKNTPNALSKLWVFLTLNYIFCDVFSLYLSSHLQELLNGGIGEIKFTETFLLHFAIIMEIPLVMVVLSYFMKLKINRIINIIAATFMIIIQVGSLATGKNSLHYWFFSSIEISTLLLIIGIAFNGSTKK